MRETLQGTFNLSSVVIVTILVHLLKKGNKELLTNVNLGQNGLRHVFKSCTSQLYQDSQVNQDMKVLFFYDINFTRHKSDIKRS